MKFLFGYLLLLSLGLLTSVTAQDAADYGRLKSLLFQSYDKSHLPSNATEVEIGMGLTHLIGLDFYKGTIDMNVELIMRWRDPRLSWQRNVIGSDIIYYNVPASDIWIPDITLYNSNAQTENLEEVTALLTMSGEVNYRPPLHVQATCELNPKDYPYDTHTCRLKWASFAYLVERISLTLTKAWPTSGTVDVQKYERNLIWEIVDTSGVKNNNTYECCPNTVEYEDVTFSVVVRRRETHGRIASSVITTWLILIVFLIAPSSAGQRIFFAGFIFVALVVLSAALSAEIPAYSETRLGRFLIGGMLITVIVSIVNGFIYRFYPKEKPGQLQEGDGASLRSFICIDVGAFLGTAIILAVSTAALFI